MRLVNAIEAADRDDAAPVARLEVVQANNDFHYAIIA